MTDSKEHSSILLVDGTAPRRIKLRLGSQAPAEMSLAALPFFDDEMTAVHGRVPELPSFIETARRIEPKFRVSKEAIDLIFEIRDRIRRQKIASSLSIPELKSLLHKPLNKAHIPALLAAFQAGRAHIPGSELWSNAPLAVAIAELFRRQKMAASVLVVCPSSLKAQWVKTIASLSSATQVTVEGEAPARRQLYSDEAYYKIASFHTVANDARALTEASFDILIVDQAHRLTELNPQISKTISRINADFVYVLSADASFAATDKRPSFIPFKTITVPHEADAAKRSKHLRINVAMTREQQHTHAQALSKLSALLDKWRKLKFLSEKERIKLIDAIREMQGAAVSTGVLDPKNRRDTKMAECVQIIRDFKPSAHRRVLVVSHWEDALGFMAEELNARGIACSTDVNKESDSFVSLMTVSQLKSRKVDTPTLCIFLDPVPEELTERLIHDADSSHKTLLISLVSADSIESHINALPRIAAHELTDILERLSAWITVDDATLAKLAATLGSMHSSGDSLPANEDSDAPSLNINLDKYIYTDPQTEISELRIPIDKKDSLSALLNSLTSLLS